MRQLSWIIIAVLCVSASLASGQAAPSPTPGAVTTSTAAPASPKSALLEGEQQYRAGKFSEAMHSYQEALKQNPKSAAAYEGAVRSYLKLDMVSQAFTTAQEGLKQAPEQSLTHAAMGEALFRKAKIEEAQHEFTTAYNLSDRDARAAYGLYRIYRTASYYAKAKEMLETAHQIDPEDRDIQYSWMNYRPRKEKIAWLEQRKAKETDPKERAWFEKVVAVLKSEEKSPHACKLATNITETQVPLRMLMPDPMTIEGVELKVVINGKAMNLLLDTGASGILLKKSSAGGAGVLPALETSISGIGDEGRLAGYMGYADSIKIGALEFQNCIIDVAENTNRQGRQVMANYDGLMGADVFASYLVSIDFPGEKVTLKPLPHPPGESPAATALISAGELSGEESEPTQDRYFAPEMRNYTPFFRFGHNLVIPTRFGETEPRLFIIDSGAESSFISPTAAREVTLVGYDLDLQVGGLSGKVDSVSRAKRTVLQFGHVRQEHLNMMAFDTSPISRSMGIEISGSLGYTALGFMQMDIDYRDGLVNFSYDPKKYRPVRQWRHPGQ